MAKKLYVGNLNYATTEDQLQELFAQYGTVVSVNIINDKYSGRSKGFGFVELEEDDAATAAMTALNGTNFDGRDLRVNEALERKPRRDRF